MSYVHIMKYGTAAEMGKVNFVQKAHQDVFVNLNKEANTCEDDLHLIFCKKHVYMCLCRWESSGQVCGKLAHLESVWGWL